VKEYLHFVPEARIREIEDFFQRSVGIIELNRQAIESAIKRHPETFTAISFSVLPVIGGAFRF